MDLPIITNVKILLWEGCIVRHWPSVRLQQELFLYFQRIATKRISTAKDIYSAIDSSAITSRESQKYLRLGHQQDFHVSAMRDEEAEGC